MRASTRIILTYRLLACFFLILSGILAYGIWSYEPVPNTLGEVLRPVIFVAVIMIGIAQAYVMLNDRLAKRLVRTLQSKSL
jgi:type IV secretory pathway TrbL component